MADISGGALLEVRFRDIHGRAAEIEGCGQEGDETGKHADIVKDKESGPFTLCFTNSKRKRYTVTMEKFKIYS